MIRNTYVLIIQNYNKQLKIQWTWAWFTNYLRKNPKSSMIFSLVYLKFILSYKVKIFIDFYL